MKLAGKIVWLTGASSGIGEAVAIELARRGAKVAISARRKDLLDALAEKIQMQGGQVVSTPCDVTDMSSVKAAVAAIKAHFGAAIDIAIANAGTHCPTDPLNFNSAAYMGLMQINYQGMLHTIEAALPDMLSRKDGYIVGVASLVGYRGLPKAGAYGATKAAMINFLDSIRFHLKSEGIKVSVVNPGFVKTPLTDKNDFHMPFLIDAEAAARYICDGLESEKHEITFPFLLSWIVWLGRLLPSRLYQFIVDFMW